MKIFIPLFLLSIFLLQSCGNETKEKATETPKRTTKIAEKENIEEDNYTEMNDEPDEDDFVYPETGNKASDFMPKMAIYDYEIQYETMGDLNNDGLKDIVIVLRNKEIKTARRPILILLQNKDKIYHLDKVSNVVIPIEFNEYDYKLFDTEEISIENGELNIKLYGKDNSFGTFKYFGNDLLLSYVEVFYRGAGSQQGIKYDFVKGEQTTTEIDLISDVESPKVTESKSSIDKEKHHFENISIINFFNDNE